MRKLIAAINMSLDGIGDHTAMNPDEEIHQHYVDLINKAGAIIYGRITFQLMESYWPTVVKQPTGKKEIDNFAIAIDNIPKIIFSHTLKKVEWKNSILAQKDIKAEILSLKEQPGNDILVGSPGLISASFNLNLIDEFQLCVHPVIVGKGVPLFKNINDKIHLKLLRTKTFSSGAVILTYEPLYK